MQSQHARRLRGHPDRLWLGSRTLRTGLAVKSRLSSEELIEEWKHTWPRHRGDIAIGAPIFNMTSAALARRFYRLRKQGYEVDFFDPKDK